MRAKSKKLILVPRILFELKRDKKKIEHLQNLYFLKFKFSVVEWEKWIIKDFIVKEIFYAEDQKKIN